MYPYFPLCSGYVDGVETYYAAADSAAGQSLITNTEPLVIGGNSYCAVTLTSTPAQDWDGLYYPTAQIDKEAPLYFTILCARVMEGFDLSVVVLMRLQYFVYSDRSRIASHRMSQLAQKRCSSAACGISK